MKSYAAYMNEISADCLYIGLLKHGLFSEKLPPVFSMDDFWNYSKSMTGSFCKKAHDYVYYESIRNNGIPRPFGLPTPMSYKNLCEGLKKNWTLIQKHFRESTSEQSYKVSRIHLRTLKDTAKLFEMNYKKWWIDPEPEIDLQIGAKYVVRSDISTCFPSIYSHSIPWALVGKDESKTNRNNSKWYNEIDKLCTATKSGETHGLLIGPHTSNLISEIILCAVDKRLSSKYKYVRNIDDYECYVESVEMGESFISDLGTALREFDLSLNRKKTTIERLPVASSKHWTHTIKNSIAIQIEGHKVERKHIQSFLDTVINIVDESEDAAALKYAIRLLKGKELDSSAEEYYVKKVLHLSFIYPYIVPLLNEYVFSPFKVPKKTIREFTKKLYDDAKKSLKYEVLYYALYFALLYDFKINSFSSQDCIEQADCFFMFFSWLYCKKCNLKDDVKVLEEQASIIKESNMDRFWIFVYEALPASDLNEEWKALKKRKVSFLQDEFHY